MNINEKLFLKEKLVFTLNIKSIFNSSSHEIQNHLRDMEDSLVYMTKFQPNSKEWFNQSNELLHKINYLKSLNNKQNITIKSIIDFFDNIS